MFCFFKFKFCSIFCHFIFIMLNTGERFPFSICLTCIKPSVIIFCRLQSFTGPFTITQMIFKANFKFFFSIFCSVRFSLQVRNGIYCRIKLISSLTLPTEVNGPRYSEPSLIFFLVRNIVGKVLFYNDIRITFIIFRLILNCGWNCLISEFSSKKASCSELTIVNSI